MTKNTNRQPEGAQDEPVEPTEGDQPTVKDGGVYLEVLAPNADGEVTFTRPGVEAKTFDVKDGRVRVSEEEADWLIRNSVARYPAADAE